MPPSNTVPPSMFAPYVYSNYSKFLSSPAMSEGNDVTFTTKSARVTYGNGNNSRNRSTVVRRWRPPGSIQPSMLGDVVTVIFATAIRRSVVSAPSNVLVNGQGLPTSLLLSSMGTDSTRFDVGYWYGDANSLTEISATLAGPVTNYLGLHSIFILPGKWIADGPASTSPNAATTPPLILNPHTFGIYCTNNDSDANPTISVTGTGVLDVGNNSARWYNGAAVGMLYAGASGASNVQIQDITMGGRASLMKLRFDS